MEHNTNTQTHNTNKGGNTSTNAQAQERTYEECGRELMLALAHDILAQVQTCKQANEHFKQLADKYGKDVAKDILALVRESVKARVTAVRMDASAVVARLQDGERLARLAWNDLLADESAQGRAWARAVYESANCNLLDMLFKYASFVTADDLIARKSNTRVEVTSGSVYVYLFGNLIVWKDRKSGEVSYSNCGYNTPTTASRLRAFGADARIKKGVLVINQ